MDPSDTEITGGDPDFARITLQKPIGTEASDIDGDVTVTIPSNLNAWKNDDKTGGAANRRPCAILCSDGFA